jgi:peptidoglycan/LPS O-acetylase OafA/YrhL
VWRRFGPWAQLAVALVIGLAPQLLFHGALAYTAPWLLGLFAMGVVAAQVTASGVRIVPAVRWLAFAAGVAAIAAMLPAGDAAADGSVWPSDLIVGAAVALLFVTGGGTVVPLTARLLSLRPVVTLGTFSYSLYLIHGPMVLVAAALLLRLHAGTALSAVVYGALIPLVIGLAYAFYLVAERPFLSPEFRAALELAPDHTERMNEITGTAVIVTRPA